MVTWKIKPLKIKNNQCINRAEIPIFAYSDFFKMVSFYLQNSHIHCTSYFAFPEEKDLMFICCLANDQEHVLYLFAHQIEEMQEKKLKSLSEGIPALQFFEREIAENYGVHFEGHPWDKPVRYAHNRHDPKMAMASYPFYQIESEELHEVGVGPIHAGIIEPGHFRFICHGERVLNLEIQLGWQHRGIESLFLSKKGILERTILAEQIAGDTTIGHTLAWANALESLVEIKVEKALHLERTLALELERIAVHTGDMSALCNDVAYQLGTNVFGVLRTPIINFTQAWCGNRLGKSLIRPGGTRYPLTSSLMDSLEHILDDYEVRFIEMAGLARTLPGIENRFESIGTLSQAQARLIGTVGMAARMYGISRDIRNSHAFSGFLTIPYEPVILDSGDVISRFLLRKLEIRKSLEYIRRVLAEIRSEPDLSSCQRPLSEARLASSSLTVSLTEGWRGEICHVAITDSDGEIQHYKIKDPSMHNWKALELSLRNQEISDFPINNKSYNLSYCGHDL